MKARFKGAQLLPKQLFAGWQFAENFNQSSKSFHVRPPQQLERFVELGGPGHTAGSMAKRAHAGNDD
jgi:hypothetical protein